MLSLLHASHVEFRSGWFVESIATQTLVIYVIRTRRIPFFKSKPSRLMMIVPTSAALVGAVLPYTGLAHLLGFSPLPGVFFLILFAMVAIYLLLVELAKARFYRLPISRSVAPPPTQTQRVTRQIRHRAARFIHVPSRHASHTRP
jgi:Mg2+-importing ATPase